MKNKYIYSFMFLLGISLILIGVFTNNEENETQTEKEADSYESFNDKYFFDDRSENCDDALEEILTNKDYKYSLPCIKSESIYIIDKTTNKEYTLKYSINNKLISIEELTASSIEIITTPLFKTMIEVQGTNIKLRKNHGTNYDQIESHKVTKGETYEMLDIYKGDNYIWYNIKYKEENGWFADNGQWARVYKEYTDKKSNRVPGTIKIVIKETKKAELLNELLNSYDLSLELSLNNTEESLYKNMESYFYKDSLLIDKYVEELLKKDKIEYEEYNDFIEPLSQKIGYDFEANEYGEYLEELSKLTLLGYEKEIQFAYYLPVSKYYNWNYPEGCLDIEMDYETIKNAFGNLLSDEIKSHLNIILKITEYSGFSNTIFSDASLMLSFEEFEEIILMYDDYMKKYSSNKEVKEEYNYYFGFYTGEYSVDNTSLFDENSYPKTNQDALESYKDILDNHKDFSRYDEIEEVYNKNK